MSADDDRARFTTVHSRYHIGCGDELIETAETIAEAKRLASAYSANPDRDYPRERVGIFDSMARRGQSQRWAWRDGEWAVVERRSAV